MRNIKMLGLLAVAAMALLAFVGTSAASATSTFTAGSEPEAISTSKVENHVFTLTGASMTCGVTAFTGETTGPSASGQVVAPSYAECITAGFTADVVENGCEYESKAETDGANMATVRVFGCDDETKGIQIVVNNIFAKCTIDMPEQSIASAVGYANTTPEGRPMAVDVEVTATGIMADVTTSSGLCPLETGTHEGGNGASYTGVQSMTTEGGVTWSA